MAANPKPHPKILALLTPRWSESGTIAIVDKIGVRGSPAVSNVARVYLFRDATLITTVQARTGGYAYDKKISKWVSKNTPTGAFRVQAKIAAGYSNLYEAEMPWFSVFNGDIGFHYSTGF
ncbi:MAG: L,D-transpeptidase, partial [Candidatus Saccharimonadales bacterium]